MKEIKKNLKLESFLDYKFLSNLDFNPKGNFLAFTLSKANLEENSYDHSIYVLSTENKNYKKLTYSAKEKNSLWLNNDKILFSADRDEKIKEKIKNGENWTSFYCLDINGGEAYKFMNIPLSVTNIKKIDEENFLLTGIFDNYGKDINNLKGEEKKKAIKEFNEAKDYEILDEIPFWSNGSGFINKKRNRLYLFNKKENKLSPITDEYTNIELFNISEDKEKIIFIAETHKDKYELTNGLYVYHLKTKKIETIVEDKNYNFSYANFIEEKICPAHAEAGGLSVGTKIICAASDMKAYGMNENHKIYLIDYNENFNDEINSKLNLLYDNDSWLVSTVGSDCRLDGGKSIKVLEDKLYFISTENDSSYLYSLDLDGNILKLTEANGSVDCFDINSEKNIFYVGMKNYELQEIYELENKNSKQITAFDNNLKGIRGEATTQKGNSPKDAVALENIKNFSVQITDFNKEIFEKFKISVPEKILFETNGDTTEGFVIKPTDYDETDKNKIYPAILDIHGGPKTVYGNVFYHEMQVWANLGYFVFFCNPHGSDGKGNKFADIRGKYGTIDYDDIMKWTDYVLENYSIDKERVAVTGGSYGGFMTNWIIGHTDRFKCAASQRSISNWISKFCTTDIGYFFNADQNSSTPWENHDKLWWHSPLKYANKVKTPTLFIHSEEDYRCWLAEGIQMFTALKYHGVDARLCMFKEENHELSRSGKPKHRIKRLEEITAWFEKYLK